MSICLSKLCKPAIAIVVQILNPVGHLLGRARPDVTGDVWLTANQFAELKKFVCTETVILGTHAPRCIYSFGALIAWTNAIAPFLK
jgi:hypothetical protein